MRSQLGAALRATTVLIVFLAASGAEAARIQTSVQVQGDLFTLQPSPAEQHAAELACRGDGFAGLASHSPPDMLAARQLCRNTQ